MDAVPHQRRAAKDRRHQQDVDRCSVTLEMCWIGYGEWSKVGDVLRGASRAEVGHRPSFASRCGVDIEFESFAETLAAFVAPRGRGEAGRPQFPSPNLSDGGPHGVGVRHWNGMAVYRSGCSCLQRERVRG